MGCSKNLVDSERLMASLMRNGFEVEHNPSPINSDTLIINTCGFIGDAKEESIDMILRGAKAKEQGNVGQLIVMGCLSERYMQQLKSEMPEVDAWFGKFDWNGITRYLTGKSESVTDKPWNRVLTTLPHSTYIKISEGCNRKCAFCAIPIITGPHRSRPRQEILDEVKDLVSRGVKEFNVIAQDLSSYGLDISHRQELPRLIDDMASIDGVEWIRLHYAYPSQFPMEIADVMASHGNVCKYLDIALQHISDKVLSNMRRHITADQTVALIEELRKRVPDLHLRTTMMVGFPGEGEKEFGELLDFIESTRFERLGAFAYCEEEDTWAARTLKDNIPDKEKQERLDTLMALQEDISEEIQEKKIGKTLRVLIDTAEDDVYIGRTQWDSPEVDPEVIIEKPGVILTPGEFYDVKIHRATPFELYGEV